MTDEEVLRAVIQIGVQMRAAQAIYFKNRSTGNLAFAKMHERNFDELARFALSGAGLSAIKPRVIELVKK
jgi:hypothetical protein